MPDHPNSDDPLYVQIAETIRGNIDSGRFQVGARLPGSRSMATALGVSRTVVLMAFEQLESEGYLESRTGSGTFVRMRSVALTAPEATQLAPPAATRVPRLSRLAQRAERPNLLESRAPAHSTPTGDLIDLAQPRVKSDPRSLKAWRQQMIALLRRRETPDFPELQGALSLRQALSGYLRSERAIKVDPADILIVSGAQQARDLIARVLLDEGAGVAVEEPCHWSIRHSYAANGARIVPCPVDANGMNIDLPTQALTGVRLLNVAPSFQFPTGTFMPEARRRALLQWAYANDACLVEDDFDCEHRVGVPTEPSMWTLDRHDHVIHASSFARSMFPALQLGYMLVPRALREAFLTVKWLADRGSISMQQHVLAAFISSGQYLLDLRRIAYRLAVRHRALQGALQAHLGTEMQVTGSVAGGSLFVHLPALPIGCTTALETESLARGLRIRGAERFFREPLEHTTLLLGYSDVSEANLKRAASRLAAAYRAVAGR